jgi:hypothetical protein
MKEVEKLVTVYVAEDGKEFSTKGACQAHEDKKSFDMQRCEFLEKEIYKIMLVKEGLVEDWILKDNNTDSSGFIRRNIWIKVHPDSFESGYILSDDTHQEFDEDCPYDISKWFEIEREVQMKFGYTIKDSSYYWPK